MSKKTLTLGDFYVAYEEWLDAGAPGDMRSTFWRTMGLCSNLVNWMDSHNIDYRRQSELEDEMRASFEEVGLVPSYPFYEDSARTGPLPHEVVLQFRERYRAEGSTSSCHLNPLRVAWVRKHAMLHRGSGQVVHTPSSKTALLKTTDNPAVVLLQFDDLDDLDHPHSHGWHVYPG